ncbi:Serine/threonine-protein kinase 17A [Harpegnathos saltator]|uniref:Serine/threonine-protein kinase 17A n=2 Tax=Harpegnathos saltator TaxID=610380 RepID=E2BMD5_HARSA|nr:Serine/threonine-protein kinase 17A [Harpegnathos saltator]
MWSVGVLLYVLLTGCSPFGGDTKQETFCNISRCRLDFPDDLFEDVSEEARDLMRKLMVKDPIERLTVTECLQHPWFSMFEQPPAPLLLSTCSASSDDSSSANFSMTNSRPDKSSSSSSTSSSNPFSSFQKLAITNGQTSKASPTPKSDTEKQRLSSSTGSCHNTDSKQTTSRAISSHTENLYTKSTKSPSKSSPKSKIRFGLSPDRRDTFKRNMDSLARKFSATEIVIIESMMSGTAAGGSESTSTAVATANSGGAIGGVIGAGTQRRATATHTMPAGEVFKCTPVFILGEEQQCSDSGSDTVSEISTDSSSDRSSIYSDDSLDFILYGKSQGRASFPFSTTDSTADRWEQRHHQHRSNRVWPRECNGVVSKALSRFMLEAPGAKIAKIPTMPPTSTITSTTSTTAATTTVRGRTAGLEALRERGGNLVVIREPVRAGRYTRYCEVQCESVQARIRRFQMHDAS